MKNPRKPRKNFTLSQLTIKQIEEMALKYNISMTEVIERAVDRMYQQEKAEDK